MKITTKTLRRIVRVQFPPGIDYHKLAQACGVLDARAWNWLKHGKVPEKYIKKLRSIPIEAVSKNGK